MANHDYFEPAGMGSKHLYLLKNDSTKKQDLQKLKAQKMNKDVNLICGVDIDYLELIRKEAGMFVSSLAKLLGISLQELREYINFDKICPISFAENWELTIRSLKN